MDDEQFHAGLGRLDRWQAGVFAASCAEVLYPSYARFVDIERVGDSRFVRSTLDAAWERLEGGEGAALPSGDEVLRLLPLEEDWNDWAAQAENAIGALSIVVGILDGHGKPGAAADAAYQAYEAADELANRWEDDTAVPEAVDDEVARQKEAVRTSLPRWLGHWLTKRVKRRSAAQRLPEQSKAALVTGSRSTDAVT
ncbi:DUF416 family protein [Actinoplanes sp. CA-131856]